MGLFDFVLRLRRRKGADAARAKERSGDLASAVELYVAAGLGDEAARVMLLQVDGEARMERRVALAGTAVEVATSEAMKQRARAQKARAAFDVLRQSGTVAKSELCRVAAELEAAGDSALAAEAYGVAGDADGEARALTAAGAVDRLEERLLESNAADKSQREAELALAKIRDLDRMGERSKAIALARRVGSEVALAVARTIEATLLAGPRVELTIQGKNERLVLGDQVTIGRSDATLVLAALALSRRHLVIRRRGGEPEVCDLGSANGTMLGPARIEGAIPVGAGLLLRLGGEVDCRVEPKGQGVTIHLAGDEVFAPLGDYVVGAARLFSLVQGDHVRICAAPSGVGARLFLGPYEVTTPVDLAVGDVLSESRGGAPLLVVPGREAGAP